MHSDTSEQRKHTALRHERSYEHNTLGYKRTEKYKTFRHERTDEHKTLGYKRTEEHKTFGSMFYVPLFYCIPMSCVSLFASIPMSCVATSCVPVFFPVIPRLPGIIYWHSMILSGYSEFISLCWNLPTEKYKTFRHERTDEHKTLGYKRTEEHKTFGYKRTEEHKS
jgi:hypothetical protein